MPPSIAGSSVSAADDGDERDQHPADADAAHRGLGQDDQREQADRDGHAREHDGVAGGRHRGDDRVGVRAAVVALLAPARDDEQRVVDRDAEADERDEELHDRGDVADVRQPEHDQQRGQDRERGHQERQEREQRREHEGEHGQRAERAEERLREHAGPVGRAAGRELLQARGRDVVARGQRASQHPGRLVAHGRVAEPFRARAEDERERRAAVVGDEAPVVRGGEVDDARLRQLRPYLRERGGEPRRVGR